MPSVVDHGCQPVAQHLIRNPIHQAMPIQRTNVRVSPLTHASFRFHAIDLMAVVTSNVLVATEKTRGKHTKASTLDG